MLITGWFLSGLQTGMADPQEVMMTIVFLGLGFGFTLAIFPLYSWIPMLAEEDDPFLSGYIFLMLPTVILFFLLSYVDQYSWLRESLDLPKILQVAGLIMIVTGGLWSAFQRDLGRMLGYAVIVENGFAVLAVGLMTIRGYQLFANLFLRPPGVFRFVGALPFIDQGAGGVVKTCRCGWAWPPLSVIVHSSPGCSVFGGRIAGFSRLSAADSHYRRIGQPISQFCLDDYRGYRRDMDQRHL